MRHNDIDVSLLITFHKEGILAHSTLNSIERCRQFAEKAGIITEYILVLDSVDMETKAVLKAHPVTLLDSTIILEVDCRDAGAARNAGVNVANGTAIAILDGDDYFSTNWIERAWSTLKEYGANAVLHPEFVVNFGTQAAYCWQVDQKGQYYDKAGLMTGNYWTSWTFAYRDAYKICPYITTRAIETGFGYEDWHWNCEVISHGFVHRLVWGTIGFYRRKKISRVNSETSVNAIIPPTRLFDMKAV